MQHQSGYVDSRKRGLWIAAVIAVVLIVGFLVGRLTAPDAVGEGSSALPKKELITPDENSELGAVEAATSIAQLIAAPTGDTASYLEAAEEIAAPGWENRARELAQGAIDFVNDRYGSDASVSFQPVRYRVRSYSSDETTIDIWGVVLASGQKVGGVEESWITATLELVWIDETWKVANQSSKGGPTPELLRTEEEVSIDEVLNDFKEYDR